MASIKVTPEQLRQFGSTCDRESKSVTDVRSKVRRALESTDWESPAATKFKSDWKSKYEKALNELSEALVELGNAARTMAKNYDETERAYKG